MGEIKKLQREERRHGLHHMKDQQKKVSPQTPGTHNSTINSHYNHP